MGANVDPRLITLVAIWCETLVFGIYSSLFFETMLIASKQRRGVTPVPAKIFVTVTVLIYIGAALHCAFGLVMALHGYVFISSPNEIVPYFNSNAWEHTAYTAVHTGVSWLGQSLLVYKCYLIWNNNWPVIIPSIMVLVADIGVTIFTNIMWATQNTARFKAEISAVLPLALAQNILTTALIAYRLIRQHHESERIGVASSGRLSLMDIGMIITESATVNTGELIITTILHQVNSNVQLIFISISPSTIGIVFTLIAVRLHTFGKTNGPKSVSDVNPRWTSTVQMTTLDEIGSDMSAQHDLELESIKGGRSSIGHTKSRS
ncbi:hypothetical protein BDN72DRAFT_620490 [Pluteus cervinus]|uniref:Uncharacterized protein n=1 Tax=Pluteus cervinus TaxID=181527 RepID=A0ACD3AW84_9AGAR|nr:hypothetical protein BDN72DRAFT_620490 [Pluteus cervinus]